MRASIKQQLQEEQSRALVFLTAAWQALPLYADGADGII
jgi:hypothetical protein